MSGMLITFSFLILYTALQPYCTPGLSKTQACALIAQFISLFSGICLIVESYEQKDEISAGQGDTTGQATEIFGVLIMGINLVIMAWPSIMFFTSGEFSEKYEAILDKLKSITHKSNDSFNSDLVFVDTQIGDTLSAELEIAAGAEAEVAHAISAAQAQLDQTAGDMQWQSWFSWLPSLSQQQSGGMKGRENASINSWFTSAYSAPVQQVGVSESTVTQGQQGLNHNTQHSDATQGLQGPATWLTWADEVTRAFGCPGEARLRPAQPASQLYYA